MNKMDQAKQIAKNILLIVCFSWTVSQDLLADPLCQGHFINPISDICWDCLFPLTIGSAEVVRSDKPDTDNPKSPIGTCFNPWPIIGVNIGYWEPTALVDVVRKPYCLVNLGGIQLDIDKNKGIGGKQVRTPANSGAFYYAHWYKYPLIYWLQLIVSSACRQEGQFDIGYLTELDPTWNDDELAFILNPEAILFGNNLAQAACAADAMRTSSNHLPIDSLFWCLGTQGSVYPLSGWVFDEKSPIEAATLIAERLDFKLHRESIVLDSDSTENPCNTYPHLIMPKSRYRYQMTNIVPEGNDCHPFGHITATWEKGHDYPTEGNQFGFLIWQKRNCVFL